MPSDTSETGGLDSPEIKRPRSICERIMVPPKRSMSDLNLPSKWILIGKKQSIISQKASIS